MGSLLVQVVAWIFLYVSMKMHVEDATSDTYKLQSYESEIAYGHLGGYSRHILPKRWRIHTVLIFCGWITILSMCLRWFNMNIMKLLRPLDWCSVLLNLLLGL